MDNAAEWHGERLHERCKGVEEANEEHVDASRHAMARAQASRAHGDSHSWIDSSTEVQEMKMVSVWMGNGVMLEVGVVRRK